MKISTMGRYGIKLLLDLARYSGKAHTTLKNIARRQNISVRYLEHVAITLRRAGLIRSVKGASGGYALAKRPEEIHIGDALRALEGDMLVVDPLAEGAHENKFHACVRRTVLEPLNCAIAASIDKETIASITGTAGADESYMYFI
ncbi:MAG: Rrf2 family transcriptional regulator [Spirochaetaceae bacterium]|jgi:Rrf2 family protein|nr:Rrf2 family transcriptional regulator [Spirochaetaceae bacterium]